MLNVSCGYELSASWLIILSHSYRGTVAPWPVNLPVCWRDVGERVQRRFRPRASWSRSISYNYWVSWHKASRDKRWTHYYKEQSMTYWTCCLRMQACQFRSPSTHCYIFNALVLLEQVKHTKTKSMWAWPSIRTHSVFRARMHCLSTDIYP